MLYPCLSHNAVWLHEYTARGFMQGNVALGEVYHEILRLDEYSKRLSGGGAEESENDLVPGTF